MKFDRRPFLSVARAGQPEACTRTPDLFDVGEPPCEDFFTHLLAPFIRSTVR